MLIFIDDLDEVIEFCDWRTSSFSSDRIAIGTNQQNVINFLETMYGNNSKIVIDNPESDNPKIRGLRAKHVILYQSHTINSEILNHVIIGLMTVQR